MLLHRRLAFLGVALALLVTTVGVASGSDDLIEFLIVQNEQARKAITSISYDFEVESEYRHPSRGITTATFSGHVDQMSEEMGSRLISKTARNVESRLNSQTYRAKIISRDPVSDVGTSSDGGPLNNGVAARWDMTRRVTVRATTSVQGLQLVPADGMHNYPNDPNDANDDSDTHGEDNNPYDAVNPGALYQEDHFTRQGPGEGRMTAGVAGDRYQVKAWFQDFARLQLGPEAFSPGPIKWFRISDYLPWRLEYNMKKLELKETDWQEDSNGVNGIEIRAMLEQDIGFAAFPQQRDFNADGQINGPLAYWDQDPGNGSFLQEDNAGLPQ